MGTKRVEQGPVGETVRRTVRTLREQRRLSLVEVSQRMGEAGRPMLPSGISKIEQGERRVDVDDLVALAQCLGVTPAQLLEGRVDATVTADVVRARTVTAAATVDTEVDPVLRREVERAVREAIREVLAGGDVPDFLR